MNQREHSLTSLAKMLAAVAFERLVADEEDLTIGRLAIAGIASDEDSEVLLESDKYKISTSK